MATVKSVNQYSLFEPVSDWVPPSISSLPDISKEPIIAFDAESRDPELSVRGGTGTGMVRKDKNAYPVGIALACPGFKCYLPFNHANGGNLPPDEVIRYTQAMMYSPGVKVGHNTHYDLGCLFNVGIEPIGKPGVSFADTMIQAALLDETLKGGYSLDNCLKYFLNDTGKTETLLIEAAVSHGFAPSEAKGILWALHSKFVGPYAEDDAAKTLDLYLDLVERLEEQGLERVADIEMRLIPVTFLMSQRGLPIDIEAAEKLSTQWQEEEHALRLEVEAQFGCKIDINSSAKLASLISDKFDGITIPKTAKDGDSISNEWLDGLNVPVLHTLATLRRLTKARRDYVDGFFIKYHRNGVLHPDWRQTARDAGGTRSGRMSASNPSPQVLPVRDPNIGPLIRALVTAIHLPRSPRIASADYNSQEIRIFIHVAAELVAKGVDLASSINPMFRAQENEDIRRTVAEVVARYQENPMWDLHKHVAEMMGISRSHAKTINFAILYAAGIPKLAGQLGCDKEQARVHRTNHEKVLPFATAVLQHFISQASSRGYVRTILGRRRRFIIGDPKDIGLGHYIGLNACVQGSAADQMKVAAVNLYEKHGIFPFALIHDEGLFPVYDDEDKKIITSEMEGALQLHVPVIADVGVGVNWTKAKEKGSA